ncbi:MAG TPA: ATP-grasp domain-containing protein [Frankiaceae bacterium]|nr:ATP-grasp domain-containing protein [Frankiaceae bacterium]
MLLVVPSDPLRPRRPDEHFAPEYDAARDAGLDVALVDHDALTAGAAAEACARLPASNDVVYRGWMLRAEEYAAFDAAARDRGATLRTSAAQYRTAHELPGWYDALRDHTPFSAVAGGFTRSDFDECRAAIGSGAAVLRDHVKSAKHYWHQAAYVPDVADAEAAWRVAERFLEVRDDARVGGFVLRRYEPFTGAEVRTWWVGGRCALVTAHPDEPDAAPGDVDVSAVAPAVASLGLPFVTVDLARVTSGAWRVVELGDGQVSDRPRTTDPAALVAALTG